MGKVGFACWPSHRRYNGTGLGYVTGHEHGLTSKRTLTTKGGKLPKGLVYSSPKDWHSKGMAAGREAHHEVPALPAGNRDIPLGGSDERRNTPVIAMRNIPNAD